MSLLWTISFIKGFPAFSQINSLPGNCKRACGFVSQESWFAAEGGLFLMRKIDPKRFKIAKRHTSREINRQIALTLIRTHQPVSRADLARLMGTRRGVVSILVNELLAEGLIFEGATGEGGGRGRKPTFLYIDSRERYVIAVDIRATRTYLMATD